jgi:hypothetical protein
MAADVSLPSAMTARHSSETDEHYTPQAIVESAREALGGIDLDPASCPEANECVRAAHIFDRGQNGFQREWRGRVFLNPPGGLSDSLEQVVKPNCRVSGVCGLAGGTKERPGHTHHGVESNQKKWWFKLAREWRTGRVTSAVFVMFSVELLQTTQVNTPKADNETDLPIPLKFAICFPRRRIAYCKPGGAVGRQPPHSSGIVFLHHDIGVNRFKRAFERHGEITLGVLVKVP